MTERDYLDYAASVMTAEDIFMRLGMVHRYCGTGVSVAAHSIAVHDMLDGKPPIVRMLGLLHDCEEAVTGDIVVSLKNSLSSGMQSYINGLRVAMIGRLLGDDVGSLAMGSTEWQMVHDVDMKIRQVEKISKRPKVWHDIDSSVRAIKIYERLKVEL